MHLLVCHSNIISEVYIAYVEPVIEFSCCDMVTIGKTNVKKQTNKK